MTSNTRSSAPRSLSFGTATKSFFNSGTKHNVRAVLRRGSRMRTNHLRHASLNSLAGRLEKIRERGNLFSESVADAFGLHEKIHVVVAVVIFKH